MFYNFINKEAPAQVFFFKFGEMFEITFVYRTPLVSASIYYRIVAWLTFQFSFSSAWVFLHRNWQFTAQQMKGRNHLHSSPWLTTTQNHLHIYLQFGIWDVCFVVLIMEHVWPDYYSIGLIYFKGKILDWKLNNCNLLDNFMSDVINALQTSGGFSSQWLSAPVVRNEEVANWTSHPFQYDLMGC